MNQFIAYCGLDCETCGDCGEMQRCEKLGAITGNNAEARQNLCVERERRNAVC